jgi:hypothetical protein
MPDQKSSPKPYNQKQLNKIFIQLSNKKDYSLLKTLWWNHTDDTSLRLTLKGFEFLNRELHLKTYIFDTKMRLSSKNLIDLEKFFPGVYYLLNNGSSGSSKIAIFDEDIASMLTLIDGDLTKYLSMQEKNFQ